MTHGDKVELARDGTKQGTYYDQWGKFARDADKQLDEEDKIETEENKKALGIDDTAPKSEAQKKDLDKHHALKEAKKEWEKRMEVEEDGKKQFKGLTDQTITIDQEAVGKCIVLDFSGNKGCTFTIPDSVKLVKVFVAGCDNCTFNVHCRLLTSHLEMSRCNDVIVNVEVPLATLQVCVALCLFFFDCLSSFCRPTSVAI